MHRHSYQGRKFHRERDQREALIKGLAESLVLYGRIETTFAKAKEVQPYIEKLIGKAKKGDLHNRRQVISGLQTLTAAHKLVDDIAPKLKGRSSGYTRIVKGSYRRGDNASLASLEFVDDLSDKPVQKAETKPDKPAAKKKA